MDVERPGVYVVARRPVQYRSGRFSSADAFEPIMRPGRNDQGRVHAEPIVAPKGDRRASTARLLNQAANSAVKTKGSIFELVYRRLVPRLGHQQAIGAIANRLCRLIWKILHDGITYDERGPAVTTERLRGRSAKMTLPKT
jgi:hypothetical protein